MICYKIKHALNIQLSNPSKSFNVHIESIMRIFIAALLIGNSLTLETAHLFQLVNGRTTMVHPDNGIMLHNIKNSASNPARTEVNLKCIMLGAISCTQTMIPV